MNRQRLGPLGLTLGLAAALGTSAAPALDLNPGLTASAAGDLMMLAEVRQSASGKMDCSEQGLAQADPRRRKMMERMCARKAASGKPSYKISNPDRIASTSTPPDVYQAADRAELETLVLDAWKTKWPKDEVLGVHFPSKNWKRNKNKRWNSAMKQWDYNDTSVLALRVVVKEDAEKATIFPAYVNRRNDSGEINAGVATKTNEYVVTQMLVKNYGQ